MRAEKSKNRIVCTAIIALMCLVAAFTLGISAFAEDGATPERDAKQLSMAGFDGWSQVTFQFDPNGVENANTLFVRMGVDSEDPPMVYNMDYVSFKRGDTDLTAPDGMLFQGSYVGFAWGVPQNSIVPTWQNGDRLTLKKGFRGYKWTGAVYGSEYGYPNALPVGEGEFVPVCELDRDVTYEYTDGEWVRINANIQTSHVRELYEQAYVTYGLRISATVTGVQEKGVLASEWLDGQVKKYVESDTEASFRFLSIREDVLDVQLLSGEFADGDTLTFREGLPFYRYTGTVVNYGVQYDGNFMQVAKLARTLKIKLENGVWQPYEDDEPTAEAEFVQADLTGDYGGGVYFLFADEMADGKGARSGNGFMGYIVNGYIEFTPGEGGSVPEGGFDYVFPDSCGILVRALKSDSSLYSKDELAELLGNGATFTLKEGLPLYAYTGTTANYVINGDGYYTLLGRTSYDLTLHYGGQDHLSLLHNSVSISNKTALATLRKRESKQIVLTSAPTDADSGFTYTSSNPSVASVSASGVVSGLTDGTAVITVADKLNSAVQDTVNVTVEGVVAYTALGATYTNGYGKVIAYAGEDLTAQTVGAQAELKYSYGEGDGEILTVTADNLDLSGYDKNKTGVQTVRITGENDLAVNISVEVFALAKGEAQTPIIDLAWKQLKFTVGNTAYDGMDILLAKTALDRVNEGKIAYYKGGFRDTERTITQAMILAGNTVFLPFADYDKGDVLVVKAGFRTYRYTGTMGGYENLEPVDGGAFIATGEVSKDAKFIYDGSVWKAWDDGKNALATEIICSDFSLPLGARKTVQYSLAPSEAMGVVTLAETGDGILQINGLAVSAIQTGTTTLQLRLGNLTKEVQVTVTAALQPTGLKLVNGFDSYYVLKDGMFDLTKLSACFVYDGGYEGTPFGLTEDNTDFTLDASVLGERKVTLTVTYDGEHTFPLEISITVYEPREMKIDSAGPSDWFDGMFMIMASTSTTNTSSILDTAELDNVLDKMVYKRGEQTIEITSFWMLDGAVVLFFENTDDFREGDTLTILPGFTLYSFTGDRISSGGTNNVPIAGTGEFVAEAVLTREYLFTCKGDAWELHLEYEGIEIIGENVTVGLGKTADVGAIKIPENATTGSFTYSAGDSEIVRVSSSGIITGLKIGSTTVTVTLSGGAAGDKQIVINVEVVDVVKELKINVTELYIKTGDVVDAEWLTSNGVTATFVYASGKEEEVSWTDVKVSGFTPDEDGTYTVTLSLRSGTSVYSAQLTVIANSKGKKPGKGCGCGSVAGGGVFPIAVLMLTACAVLLKRKGAKN